MNRQPGQDHPPASDRDPAPGGDGPAAAGPVAVPEMQAEEVRRHWRQGLEIAVLDLREEEPFARQGHPLWSVCLPLGRIETEAWRRLPRQTVPIVLLGRDGRGRDLVPAAADLLRRLGYSDLRRLSGDLEGWQAAGGELFRDVNSASKAFGEWVAERSATPLLAPEQVQQRLAAGERLLLLDVRRRDEHGVMTLPGSRHLPGGELLRWVGTLAPDPETPVLVHCAGRTRGILAAQGLIDAGLPNPVAAVRNGTIGWHLAGLPLERGADRGLPDGLEPDSAALAAARRAAGRLASQLQVPWLDGAGWTAWCRDPRRTTYRFDVRPEAETEPPPPGFARVPAGQLIQELDHHVAVRGARIVLWDGDGVCAPAAAAWLARMGWEVALLTPEQATTAVEGTWPGPPLPATEAAIGARLLQEWLQRENGTTLVLDLGDGAGYGEGHVPGALWLLRRDLEEVLAAHPQARRLVLCCADGQRAEAAIPAVRTVLPAERTLHWLRGGRQGWIRAGGPLETGPCQLASPLEDRYRRPYVGLDHPRQAMEDYLTWEYGLVAQLERDGSHGFRPLP
ncbi:MAG: rhodanese-like domain-containing protein [Synechococcaceae cyanobacterium]|nr:rhodanese-like domain-containing protein [Synechococcaceae cyanobacterium]